MDLHERQQFEMMLQLSVERWAERLEQRNEGAANALHRLRTNPEGDGVWLTQFSSACFDDFLMNNHDGAVFVLRALPRRKLSAQPDGTVEQMVKAMAAEAFRNLLRQKTDEELERRASYEAPAAEFETPAEGQR